MNSNVQPRATTRVLLTGATGFVGRAILDRMLASGVAVLAGTRRPEIDAIVTGTQTCLFDLERPDSLDLHKLEGIDVVVHAAARVHVMRAAVDEEERALRCNVEATEALARAAVRAGTRRFVFISSIKVYGGRATTQPLTPSDRPAANDPYGRSKLQAEALLRRIEEETGLEVVIIRPPLVYGPGVRANFLRLLSLVDRRVPLPLGLVNNRRSLVAVQNLADFVMATLTHPVAPGRSWLVSDGADLSTPDLVRRMGIALGRRPRLWPMPVSLLKLGGVVLRRDAEVSRLCDSLQVDPSSTFRELSWKPPMDIEQALELTARWYRTAVDRA